MILIVGGGRSCCSRRGEYELELDVTERSELEEVETSSATGREFVSFRIREPVRKALKTSDVLFKIEDDVPF